MSAIVAGGLAAGRFEVRKGGVRILGILGILKILGSGNYSGLPIRMV